jgi:hypothetical protein
MDGGETMKTIYKKRKYFRIGGGISRKRGE